MGFTDILYRFQFLLLFQITMTKCHKFYPNCICHVQPEQYGLIYQSALFTKMFWNYSTNIVRVCVRPFHPAISELNIKRKSDKQVVFGSRAMASLYKLLCHPFLKYCEPLLKELISYRLPVFPSHIFENLVYESSDNESVQSIDSTNSAFNSDD